MGCSHEDHTGENELIHKPQNNETTMLSKIYILEIERDGKWINYNSIEYAQVSKSDMTAMRTELNQLLRHGIYARSRCIDTRDMITLTCKPTKSNPYET